MRISHDWLSDFLTWTERDPHEIARRLTLSVAEVEEVEEQGMLLAHCCVGEIMAILPHPNASKLQLADVQTDRGMKRVVCGGTNLAVGMQVAFAHVGATVRWHGEGMQTLAPATIRGEESHGMICAGEELDLQDMFAPKPEDGDRPILNLSRDLPGLKTGTPLKEALGQTDVIYHVNNTAITNRPDLFSHLGFARECVAAGLAKWKKAPPVYKLPAFPKHPPALKLVLDAKAAVPRYLGCTLEIDGAGETPEWMKRRLIATGFRPLLLPIDITNYVSHDVGMPLHSFAVDEIDGDMHCRLTKAGESITTLDDAERKLPEGALVLSDDRGIFDLMGVMGGLRSSTKATTRKIYLHAAAVDPSIIRRTITATGHRTDASTIYEKGIPTVAVEWGFARALQLFTELIPGCRITSSLHQSGKDVAPKAITLATERPSQVLGIDVPAAEIKKTLTAIGCSVKAGKTSCSVTPPPWRTKDLRTEEELIDEIARLRGYDRIADQMPSAPVSIPPRDHRGAHTRRRLASDGYQEILPLSLLSPSLLAQIGIDPAACRRVQNPLSEDLSLLQPSTLPGLLEHAKRSLMGMESDLCTMRICTVFGKTKEYQELGMLRAARGKTGLMDDPFLQLKDALIGAICALGYRVHVEERSADHAWMHPGRTAAVLVTAGDTIVDVGRISEIHPDVRTTFDLPYRAAAALISWSLLLSLPASPRKTKAAAAFPAVTYDSTVARRHSEPVGALLHKLSSAHPLLEEVTVKDLYQDPREDGYRLTLRCVYRAADRTLTEEEAKQAHTAVLHAGALTPLQ